MNTGTPQTQPNIPYPLFGRVNELAFHLDRAPLSATDRQQCQQHLQAILQSAAEYESKTQSLIAEMEKVKGELASATTEPATQDSTAKG